jgi:hypothetical protein
MKIEEKMKLSARQLEQVNRCRLWLQVTAVAKITEVEGKNLPPYAVYGTSDNHNLPVLWVISKSKFRWPAQAKPDPTAWRIWAQVLRSITDPRIPYKIILTLMLGRWNPSAFIQREWLFRQNKTKLSIQQKLADGSSKEFSVKCRTNGPHQTYRLSATPSYDALCYIVTPIAINAHSIEVSGNTRSYTDLTLANPTSGEDRRQTNASISLPHHIPDTYNSPPTYDLHLHTHHSSETQIFSWTVSQTSTTVLGKGSVQKSAQEHAHPFEVDSLDYYRQHDSSRFTLEQSGNSHHHFAS